MKNEPDDLSFLRSGNAPLPSAEPKSITISKFGLNITEMNNEEIERTRNSEGRNFIGNVDCFDKNING